jgi:hypothetical protein
MEVKSKNPKDIPEEGCRRNTINTLIHENAIINFSKNKITPK